MRIEGDFAYLSRDEEFESGFVSPIVISEDYEGLRLQTNEQQLELKERKAADDEIDPTERAMLMPMEMQLMARERILGAIALDCPNAVAQAEREGVVAGFEQLLADESKKK